MSELADIFSGISAVEAERKRIAEQRREQNRRDFPECAAFVDALRIFNPRVIWFTENGRTVGRAPDTERQQAA